MATTTRAAQIEMSTTDGISRFTPTPRGLGQKLALACRILDRKGHSSGLAGQISARGEDPATFWTQTYGLGLEEAKASNMLLVDKDLRVIDGNGSINPANRFHLWIYRHRPEVNAIIHTHPLWTSALAMIGQPLAISHMDTTPAYEDTAFLAEWPGVPFGDDEGRIISEALGDKRAILLSHHGLLTACGSLEEATILAIAVERAAQLQILASSAGTIKPIPANLGREARDYSKKPIYSLGMFEYYSRQALRDARECLD
jgi:L-fuculose-phosphate aldolase